MDRIELATIDLAEDKGRGILAIEREHYDGSARWHVRAILPDGTEEDTEVSTRWGGTLPDAVEAIAEAWRGSTWGLEWIIGDEEMERLTIMERMMLSDYQQQA